MDHALQAPRLFERIADELRAQVGRHGPAHGHHHAGLVSGGVRYGASGGKRESYCFAPHFRYPFSASPLSSVSGFFPILENAPKLMTPSSLSDSG
jgi:hypothetical protein